VRLFVALEIPSAVRDNFAAFLSEMRALTEKLGERRVRWVRPENLHVTLKFIGEVAEAKLAAIRTALSTVPSVAPIDARFRGLGFFPNENRPTVLWAGLDASPHFSTSAGDIDSALTTLGIAGEKRAFVPHLTLARFAAPLLHEKLRAAVQKNRERAFGSFQASEFQLIESRLKPSGAEYTSLASFPLRLET
jgi:RNA 2',3'-cyclic 3'-phosphodiesterase